MKTTRMMLAVACLLIAPALLAEENFLHQSVQVVMLVADADQAADRIEGWAEAQGGYILSKSSEQVLLRLPHARLQQLRPFLEELSEDILEFSPQAADLREQYSTAQSGLRSRQDILTRNMALLDQADTSGTLAIEREILGLIQEVENLKAAVQRLAVDRAYARVEIALRFIASSLPEDIPSSFAWINQVDFYSFIQGGYSYGRVAAKLAVKPPSGYAEEEKARDGAFRALSPEGLPYRVRAFANEPEKSLGFWAETLKNQLSKEGYRLKGEGESFQAGNDAGRAFEWIVPFENENYVYLTALIVAQKRILLAEAAGPYALFVQYRKSIDESLQSVRAR